MYSTADAAKLLETRTDVGQYDIDDGLARIPSIHGVPYLDVVSTLNEGGDKLILFCVNRHLQRDLRASIELTGFEAGSARGQQLTSTTLYSVNDEVRPDAVIPADLDLKVKGSAFEHVFPKTSVTVIELARR
jgi:alpha-L-arabinofuranosidase